MPSPLQISNRRQRTLVRTADALLTPLGWWSHRPPAAIDRILLLRLERIGDLLMTLEAIADVRRAWPDATIDLAVGSWNAALARMIPGLSTIHVADLPWLSRGEQPTSWATLMGEARHWRSQHYALVLNFEPDIRTNFLAWMTRAPIRVGHATGGGGAFLSRAGAYDSRSHVAENARRLVACASGRPPASAAPLATPTRLHVPPSAVANAQALLGDAARPWIGIHASGGRESKQWHLDRFAAVGRALAAATGGTIVLTGGPGDQALVRQVADQLGGTRMVSVAGAVSLPDLAGVLAALDVLVTGDTGPMHLAAAVGTPVVALFGPSDPRRYGPRASRERVVRVQLPCSPCGQVRLPPVRCRGHVPECMDGISVGAVVQHAMDLLTSSPADPGPIAHR